MRNPNRYLLLPDTFLTPGASFHCTQIKYIRIRKGDDTQEYLRVWSSQKQKKESNNNNNKKKRGGGVGSRSNYIRLNREKIQFNIS